MRQETRRKLDRLERRARWRTPIGIALAVIVAAAGAYWFVRPPHTIAVVSATVREIRESRTVDKYARLSKIIDVQLDTGETMVIASQSTNTPAPGGRIKLEKVENAFGHVTYRWDGQPSQR